MIGSLLGLLGIGVGAVGAHRDRKQRQRQAEADRALYETQWNEGMALTREQMAMQDAWVREQLETELGMREAHRERAREARSLMNPIINAMPGVPDIDITDIEGFGNYGGTYIPLQRSTSLNLPPVPRAGGWRTTDIGPDPTWGTLIDAGAGAVQVGVGGGESDRTGGNVSQPRGPLGPRTGIGRTRNRGRSRLRPRRGGGYR